MTVTAYPLSWPPGWPRTPAHKRHANSPFTVTMAAARGDLFRELKLLGATSAVVSSWLPLLLNGQLRSIDPRTVFPDPGVAVYFTLEGAQMVMARDGYAHVFANLRSIGLAIAHLRGMERHGGGEMMERAFSGFTAIEAPKQSDCWGILELPPDKRTAADIIEAFRRLVKTAHPDGGGSHEKFQRLIHARDTALQLED